MKSGIDLAGILLKDHAHEPGRSGLLEVWPHPCSFSLRTSLLSHDSASHNSMLAPGAQALVVGASLSAAAAFAHLACIVLGAPAYRFMGAGERMARAAEAGRVQPVLVTLAISAVLLAFAAYALGAAGVIGRLPLSGLVLPAICAVYLCRAIAFPFLKSAFPENSRTFWLISSSVCLVIGVVHLYGVVAVWHAL